MKLLQKLRQKLCLHDWHRDTGYPMHGYDDTPYADSYCGKCKLTGRQYLGLPDKLLPGVVELSKYSDIYK